MNEGKVTVGNVTVIDPPHLHLGPALPLLLVAGIGLLVATYLYRGQVEGSSIA